jgi:hypothetical protein
VIPYCHVAGWPFQLSKLYRMARPLPAHKNSSFSRARLSPNGFFVSTSESKREKGEGGGVGDGGGGGAGVVQLVACGDGGVTAVSGGGLTPMVAAALVKLGIGGGFGVGDSSSTA